MIKRFFRKLRRKISPRQKNVSLKEVKNLYESNNMNYLLESLIKKKIFQKSTRFCEFIPHHCFNDIIKDEFHISNNTIIVTYLAERSQKEIFDLSRYLLKIGASKFPFLFFEAFVDMHHDKNFVQISKSEILQFEQTRYLFFAAVNTGQYMIAYDCIIKCKDCYGADGLAFYEKHKFSILIHRQYNIDSKSEQDVSDRHEDLWAGVGKKLKSLQHYPNGLVNHVLKHNINVKSFMSFRPITGQNTHKLIAENQDKVYSKRGVPLFKPSVSMNEYHLTSNIYPFGNFLKVALSNNVENIVELGSGWGRNLLYTILVMFPRTDINYFFCEYADSGVEAVKEAFPAIQNNVASCVSLKFDYMKGLPEKIKELTGNTAFISSFSVEQVPEIGPAFFKDVSQLKYDYEFFQVEPIGWQTIPEFVEARFRRNGEFFDELSITRKFKEANIIDINQALSSFRSSYNYDYLKGLRQLESSGIIEIEDISKYHAPPNDIENPATLVIWRKNKN